MFKSDLKIEISKPILTSTLVLLMLFPGFDSFHLQKIQMPQFFEWRKYIILKDILLSVIFVI
jgi:hypothetical protein